MSSLQENVKVELQKTIEILLLDWGVVLRSKLKNNYK
jgi:hypothetical protein